MTVHSVSRKDRYGFTLLELFIVFVAIAILIGMMLPAVRRVRDPARRSMCQNNARQLMLGLLNYETQHGHFPAAMGSPDLLAIAGHPDANRLSGLVAILPFIEQNQIWETITNPAQFEETSFLALPAPMRADYPPWQTEIPTLLCPSSQRRESDFGQSNYAFCIGDVAKNIHSPDGVRGAFACRLNSKIDEMVDGTSNTIGLAEISTASGRSSVSNYAIGQPRSMLENPGQCFDLIKSDNRNFNREVELGSPGRGGCWADGAAGYSLFNTILPPNSPSASVGPGPVHDGFYSASGSHSGIVTAAFVDGSTHSIATDIDAGDPTTSQLDFEATDENFESLYGVWGALGSANGTEVIDGF